MNNVHVNNYKPKDFSKLINVSVKTLQRWDNNGTLKACRSITNRRYYTYDQYLQFKGIKIKDDIRKTVVYARVSNKNQKNDLKNQIISLEQFCKTKGIIVDEYIEDFGSGLNYNRKKWNKLLIDVMEQKIKTIIISHKDKFVRFGYNWFHKFCEKFNTKIIVINNENISSKEELIQDIISIFHIFSYKLYGLRKYEKQIKEDNNIAKELQN